MNERSQAEIVAFLADPATYGLGAGEVGHNTTHGAHVFLAGADAYKLKRAVTLPYLDYGTAERREAACRAELEVNRRTAPGIYLGVEPVVRRADGGLAIGGDGEAVDWVVHMRRFDEAGLLDRLAAKGPLDDALVRALADRVAAFHAACEPARADGAGAAEMRRLVETNADAMPDWFPAAAVAALRRRSLAEVDRLADHLDARRRDGWVRHGHGDLHLGNIVLHEGEPVLFDAIEFDPRLARTDILYDLAFLLMDLWHRDQRRGANLLLGRYLTMLGSHAGLAALPLFLATRAGIRAHVSATRAGDGDAAMRGTALGYLRRAAELLDGSPPRLVGIGGFSGSGKSTLARLVAPSLGRPPGAVVLRSDEVRKRLAGVAPEQPLGPEAYTAAMHERVFGELRHRAAEVLAGGQACIVDAVHDRDDTRARLAAVAADAGVPFRGIWLDVPPAELERRIVARAGDASDAGPAVLRGQLGRPPPADWTRVAAVGDPAAVLAHVRAALD